MTHNPFFRHGAGVELQNTVAMPFEGCPQPDNNTLGHLETWLKTHGDNLPAAVILETVQCEGGINVASSEWLQNLAALLQRYDVLLIADEIQAGCGRCGTFFSFETAGIKPDIICLSKSLSGYGLPLSMVLMKPEYDVWQPSEHNGTFRANNLALTTALEALSFWETNEFSQSIMHKSQFMQQQLQQILAKFPDLKAHVRGRGLVLGIAFEQAVLAKQIAKAAFQRGLLIETAGIEDQVLKVMPPLIIDQDGMTAGLEIISNSINTLS